MKDKIKPIMAIKIIKEAPQPEPIKEKCYKCGTLFTYEKEDVQYDSREHDHYVVCPNKACSTFIAVDNPSLNYIK